MCQFCFSVREVTKDCFQASGGCMDVPKLILPEVFFRICAETIVGAKKEEKHEEKIIAIDPVIGHGGIHACGLWAEQRHRGRNVAGGHIHLYVFRRHIRDGIDFHIEGVLQKLLRP